MKKILICFIVLMFGIISFREVTAKVIQIDEEGYQYYQELDVTYVESGWSSTIIIANGGRAYTFGKNDYGQLGVGDLVPRSIPTDITPSLQLSYGEEVLYVDMSNYHTVLITSENRVFTWGWGNYGGIGDGTKATRTSPVEITSNFTLNANEDFVDVSAGMGTSFAVTNQGRVFAWGWNALYQLGDGTDVDQLYPTDITSTYSLEVGEYFVEIDSGEKFSIGLTNQNRIYSWGYNNVGQIGNGTYDTIQSPTSLAAHFTLVAGEEFTAIKAGGSHSVVATNKQKVYAWGGNATSAVGDGTTINKLLPVDISSYFSFQTDEYVIDLNGYQHTIALTNQNRRFGWGANNIKQLGNGSNATVTVPTDMTSHLPAYQGDLVEVGGGHTNGYLVTSEGRLISWGDNDYGSLGDGNMGNDYDVWLPILIPETIFTHTILPVLYDGIDDVFTGYERTFIIDEFDQVYAFGKNAFGELGIEADGDVLGPINITEEFMLNVSEVITDIAIGSGHTLFLTSDNRVFGTGVNNYGQLGIVEASVSTPVDITSLLPLSVDDFVIGVYAGKYFSVLHTNDGELIVFGRNNFGQLGVGHTNNITTPYNTKQELFFSDKVITHVGVGAFHMIFSTSTNYVYGVGYNSSGMLGIGTNANESTPRMINDGVNFTLTGNVSKLQAGTYHSAILTDTNDLYTFGANNYGQIGNNTYIAENRPLHINNQFPLALGEVIVDIELGGNHNIVRTSDGNVYVWGYGVDGVLGTGFIVPFKVPYNATTKYPSNIASISASETATFVVTTSGDIYATGKNEQGLLGLLHTEEVLLLEKMNKSAVELSDIWAFESGPYGYKGNTHIPVYLYPTYDIKDLIFTVEINGVQRSPHAYHGGMIEFLIPNTWNEGEIVTLDINSITLTDTTVVSNVSGDTTTTFEMVSDLLPPTFDYPMTLEFEISTFVEPDFLDYVTNIDDNYTEDVEVSININTVDATQTGSYQVEIKAEDDAGNTSFESITVVLFDGMPPEITYTGPQSVEVHTSVDLMSVISVIDLFDGDITYGGNTLIAPCDTSIVGLCEFQVYGEDANGNSVTETLSFNVVDTTPPTFNHPEEITIEATYDTVDFTPYITNISDNYTSNIVVYEYISNVDTRVPGIYQVTLAVEDEYGNVDFADIDVTVEDTTPPTFDPIEDFTIELGEVFNPPAIVFNVQDNSMTFTAIDCTIVYDTYVVGRYTATCTVSDEDGNEATDSFDIIVEDTTAPTFDVIPDQMISNIIPSVDWTTYVTNIDELSNDYTITEDDPIYYGLIGTYTVRVRVTDGSGNYTEQEFSVDIVDESVPLLSLIGEPTITVEVGDVFTDPGVNCADNGLACTTIINSNVDTATVGTYQITYEYTDNAGNTNSVQRTVIVEDTTPPVLSLIEHVDTVYQGESYTDVGVSVVDHSEYTVVPNITVDTSIPGTYVITYTVTDDSDNTATIIRVVTVLEQMEEPVFTFTGVTTIEVGDSYVVDCEATADNITYQCTMIQSTVNTSQAGVYKQVYTVTINEFTYQKTIHIFVYEKTVPLTLYYRKEDWEVMI